MTSQNDTKMTIMSYAGRRLTENSLNAVEREPVLTRVLNPKTCGSTGRASGENWKIFVHNFFF